MIFMAIFYLHYPQINRLPSNMLRQRLHFTKKNDFLVHLSYDHVLALKKGYPHKEGIFRIGCKLPVSGRSFDLLSR